MTTMVSLPAAVALLLAPPMESLALPRLLTGQRLEDDVLGGLAPVTAAIVATSLACSSRLLLQPHLVDGLVALVGGALALHAVLVLFGAPIAQLVPHTALLAVMLAALTALPMGLRFGARLDDWVRVLLHLRVRDADECFLSSRVLGALLGSYVGALPIPLDWDRPWQQWPLTCVYGALAGHCVGGGVGLLFGRNARRFSNNKSE